MQWWETGSNRISLFNIVTPPPPPPATLPKATRPSFKGEEELH